MYRLAMIKFHRKPEEAIMIGDQLLTDILGANRSGIEAIWVQKLEGPEFIGTRLVNRTMERFFKGFIYEALSAPANEATSPSDGTPSRSTIHQFIRFVLVGVTSFVIDFSIRWIMLFHVGYHGGLLSSAAGSSLRESAPLLFGFAKTDVEAFVPFAAALGTSVAIVNSFIWNRIWTFEIRGKVERARQFRRFFAISAIGGLLNVLLSTGFVRVLPFDAQWNVRIGTVCAAALVAIWNFAGSKMYAFKPAGVT
jgi:putative flippase GtrA